MVEPLLPTGVLTACPPGGASLHPLSDNVGSPWRRAAQDPEARTRARRRRRASPRPSRGAGRRSSPSTPALRLRIYHLSRVLIVQGRLYEAQREIGHIAEYAPNSWMVLLGGFWIGMALPQLGRLDEAFAEFDEGLDAGYRDLPDLRSNPYFEPLRRDPRFVRMLAKNGIDPGPAR